MSVQFPGQTTDETGADLLGPIQTLLEGLDVLPTANDLKQANAGATFKGPPQSVAVIEAGATALSKWWATAAAALGGTAAITTAATKFWSGQHGGARIALIAGMAGVIGFALLAIAIMVASDVYGRAIATVATYQARAQISCQFLALTQPPAAVSSGAAADPSSTPGAGKGQTPGDGPASSPPVTANLSPANVALLLAVAGQQALITHGPSQTHGHLGGIRLTNGAVEVRLAGADDSTSDGGWYPPGEFDNVKYHYPNPPG
jgi:hypothetical protein